jgi:TRAP-type uncharacterized transport system substrate-binding protein
MNSVCYKNFEPWISGKLFKKSQGHHKALVNFKAAGMTKALQLPLHPAAERFYKSRNIPLP